VKIDFTEDGESVETSFRNEQNNLSLLSEGSLSIILSTDRMYHRSQKGRMQKQNPVSMCANSSQQKVISE
jgi:hypothetical protein